MCVCVCTKKPTLREGDQLRGTNEIVWEVACARSMCRGNKHERVSTQSGLVCRYFNTQRIEWGGIEGPIKSFGAILHAPGACEGVLNTTIFVHVGG